VCADEPTVQPPGGNVIPQPPGNSAVEIAARKGFGPLSSLANQVWHGDSRPCVSCGALVRRADAMCEACGQELSAEMIEKMRVHAGPWYVLEHVRPFPGVTCERLVRQIRRGVLTRMTIVRGPTTDHQWRFAGETPGLSKYLGVCWNCQSGVATEDESCRACRAALGELTDETVSSPMTRERREAASLLELRNVVRNVHKVPRLDTDVAKVGSIRASWIVVAIVVTLVGILFAVVKARDTGVQDQTAPTHQPIGPPAVAPDENPNG